MIDANYFVTLYFLLAGSIAGCSGAEDHSDLADTMRDQGGNVVLRDLKLVSVSFKSTDVSSIDFGPVLNCGTIERFYLFHTNVSDAQLRDIANSAPTLRHVVLSSSDIGDSTVLKISQCNRLEFIDIDHTLVTSKGLRSLASLTSLDSLDAMGTPIDSETIEMIEHANPKADVKYSKRDTSRQLRDAIVALRRNGVVIGESGHIQSFRYLMMFDGKYRPVEKLPEYLAVIAEGGKTRIGITQRKAEVIKAVSRMDKLHGLKITGDFQATDEELRLLLRPKGIFKLTVESQNVTSAGLQTVAKLEGLEQLLLDVNVDPEGLGVLGECQSLKSLNLYGEDITDASLHFLADIATLKEVAIGTNTKVTRQGIERLKSARSDLKIRK